MAFVTDPDDLDRFKILFNPKSGQETIAIRGLGAELSGSSSTTGTTLAAGTSNFTDASADFVTDGVAANDIVVVAKQNASDTDVINYYEVQSVVDLNTLTVQKWNPTTQAFDTNPTASTASDLYYKIFDPTEANAGTANPAVTDGVSMQALYSFCKEQWRTLSDASMDDLIKFVFPFESITREQFELGGATHSDWTFNGDYSRNLIRTGGWEELNVGGTTLARYSGIITLGSLDSDAQVYYQQHATTVDPIDFVLTDSVNQAINVYDLVSLADTGTGYAITGNNTITRNDGGNWATDGYKAGGQITIIDSENSGENDGTFTISTVADAVDGALVVTGTPLTNNAADTTLQAAVDKRSFLKLFVRKKARTYAQSAIADIGVSQLETIVNRFPLAHLVDSAITKDDGLLAGSPDGTNDIVWGQTTAVATSSASGGAEGIRDATSTDGVFEFTHTGALFTTTNEVAAGDVITFGSGALNGKTYEIQSVTDADNLVLFQNPGDAAIADEDAVTYSTRTRYIVFPGSTDGVNADPTPDDTLGTLTSATVGDFAAAGVSAGDYLRITEGGTVGAALEGVYKIDSVATTTLTVNITDNENWSTGTGIDFEILEPGMFLQYKSTTATQVVASSDNLTFADADPDTITRATGSFVTDGYTAGMAITVAGTTSNDGTYIVATVSATVLTLIAEEALTAEGPLSGSQTIDGESGFVRTLNGVDFPFNWRLFGNGGSLQDAFQWIQKELRQTVDINEASDTFRGDVNDLLMSFSTPTGTGLNMFIDDLSGDDLNNATKQDLTGDNRNFAFIAGLTINWNSNFQTSTDASRKIVVFFTDPDENRTSPSTGNEFGTTGALIVDDKDSVDMTVSAAEAGASLTKSFSFDFDNNTQGGRPDKIGVGGTEYDDEVANGTRVTVVAIDTEKAQYNLVEGTINRQNSNIITLAPALERNYSNPA